MAKILITGGSGLIGRAVSELFIKNNQQVAWLGRQSGTENGIKKYRWDLSGHYIDPEAFEGVDTVIHLAGAGVTDKRWTGKYKAEIIDSRVKSSQLLFDHIKKNNYPVKTLVGASAIGYYGAIRSKRVFSETDLPGHDFLAKCCVLWEKSYDPFIAAGINTIILRTSMALSKHGGAYKKLLPLFKLGLGAPFGDGNQYLPWIHINDLAAMYVKAAADQSLQGVYNAVAPEIVNNRMFSKQLAKSLKRPLFMPAVPKALLKLALGESAVVLTEGVEVSSQKIKNSGFKFEFDQLHVALKNLAH